VTGGSIELSGLTKRFSEIAVDNIDLTVASGEFFSLLGSLGCGKTTTLRLIAGFEQPTSGKILLGRFRYPRTSRWWRARAIRGTVVGPLVYACAGDHRAWVGASGGCRGSGTRGGHQDPHRPKRLDRPSGEALSARQAGMYQPAGTGPLTGS